MNAAVSYFVRTLDVTGVLCLLAAGCCLFYAVSLPVAADAGVYFSNFFNLLLVACVSFVVGRSFQFLQLMTKPGRSVRSQGQSDAAYGAAK